MLTKYSTQHEYTKMNYSNKLIQVFIAVCLSMADKLINNNNKNNDIENNKKLNKNKINMKKNKKNKNKKTKNKKKYIKSKKIPKKNQHKQIFNFKLTMEGNALICINPLIVHFTPHLIHDLRWRTKYT